MRVFYAQRGRASGAPSSPPASASPPAAGTPSHPARSPSVPHEPAAAAAAVQPAAAGAAATRLPAGPPAAQPLAQLPAAEDVCVGQLLAMGEGWQVHKLFPATAPAAGAPGQQAGQQAQGLGSFMVVLRLPQGAISSSVDVQAGERSIVVTYQRVGGGTGAAPPAEQALPTGQLLRMAAVCTLLHAARRRWRGPGPAAAGAAAAAAAPASATTAASCCRSASAARA